MTSSIRKPNISVLADISKPFGKSKGRCEGEDKPDRGQQDARRNMAGEHRPEGRSHYAADQQADCIGRESFPPQMEQEGDADRERQKVAVPYEVPDIADNAGCFAGALQRKKANARRSRIDGSAEKQKDRDTVLRLPHLLSQQK